MPDVGEQPPCALVEIDEAVAWASLLERQHAAILRSGLDNRPWMFWELHNPWSRAATCVDSWALLDICQSPPLLREVAERIGSDIVLFDSQIVPNPCLPTPCRTAWQSDVQFFPMQEPAGLVVRIAFGSTRPPSFQYEGRLSGSLQHRLGAVVMHEHDLAYRTVATKNSAACEYVIRYFPSSHLFERDPSHPMQMRLTEHYPWINYARMPHWLVCGEDRAGNDFATGFHTRTGRWSLAQAADPFRN